MTQYRRPYVESSVFIAFIRGEFRDVGHDCKKIFDSIIDAAQEGKFTLYTSSLTIAEVCKKKEFSELTEGENIDLIPYFREPYITIVEVDREIGEEANRLCQPRHLLSTDIPKLRPNDAIHLASAERAGCDFLLSYDHHLTGQKRDSIVIEWPKEIAKLDRRGRVVEQNQPEFDFPQPAKNSGIGDGNSTGLVDPER